MSHKMVKRYRCPFCGLAILADDSTRTFHHEARADGRTACPQWEKAMRSFGLNPTRTETLIAYDEDSPPGSLISADVVKRGDGGKA